jgi:hypothetical protein|tara:strand:+ start:560 stop:742 length:183 start_codon:yes stop_codon:yes gene_type:complete
LKINEINAKILDNDEKQVQESYLGIHLRIFPKFLVNQIRKKIIGVVDGCGSSRGQKYWCY